jgi:3-dehydroquinate synthase II/3-amino-4-hydroxybenzoic acid synthase
MGGKTSSKKIKIKKCIDDLTIKNERKRFVWFDAREFQGKGDKVLLALQNTIFSTLVVKPFQITDIKTTSSRIKMVVFIEKMNELGIVEPEDIVASENLEILEIAKKQGYKIALFTTVKDKGTLEIVLKFAPRFNYTVVKLKDETNIPLELLIAELQKEKILLLKEVYSAEEAMVSFGVLEKGSDGVLLKTNKIEEIFLLQDEIKRDELIDIELVEASVIDIRHIGMGYRGCIDTTSLMNTQEGIIVGSTSLGGILVCSETHYLPYMNLRPFRVNAGAVHSYIWAPNNKTEYITDLKAGSKVLCVNIHGKAKEVTVGRIKIEIRPLLLIEAKYNNVIFNTIVQDDWHVRIHGGSGKPRNVTTLKPGDKILAHITNPGGRHVGIKVEEIAIEV